MNNKGITRLQILIFVSSLIIILLIGVFIIDYYKAKTRDAVRIADLALIQSAMNHIYFDSATYELDPACQPGSVISSPACSSRLLQYINLPSALQEPMHTELLCTVDNCSDKVCEYTVGSIFDKDNYKIYFHLERGIDGLSKGCHYLDKDGIQ